MSTETSDTPRLSRDVVLREAMALLDDEGMAGLTMRNLGDRLGVVPMALYRHVRNKDDLLDGLLDAAVSLVPLPSSRLGWRNGLRALAHAIRSTMLAHPSIVAPVVSRPSLGPASLEIGEYGFTVLRAAGFTDEVAERGLNLLLTYTLGFVALEVPRMPLAATAAGDRDLDHVYDDIPADRYPATVAVGPSASNLVGDEQFEFGLARLLDSLEMLLPERVSRRSR